MRSVVEEKGHRRSHDERDAVTHGMQRGVKKDSGLAGQQSVLVERRGSS